MKSNIQEEPVYIHERSQLERYEFTMELLTEVDKHLNFEQAVIHGEAMAVAGSFNLEYPTILEKPLMGPILLVDIQRSEKQLLLRWRWHCLDLPDGRQRKRLHMQLLPSLPPSVFRYTRRSFEHVEISVRARTIDIESKFSVLRRRYAEVVDMRAKLIRYRKSQERRFKTVVSNRD